MAELNLPIIDVMAESIMMACEFNNEVQIKLFMKELQENLIELLDESYSPENSESESENYSECGENIGYSIDSEGFHSLNSPKSDKKNNKKNKK